MTISYRILAERPRTPAMLLGDWKYICEVKRSEYNLGRAGGKLTEGNVPSAATLPPMGDGQGWEPQTPALPGPTQWTSSTAPAFPWVSTGQGANILGHLRGLTSFWGAEGSIKHQPDSCAHRPSEFPPSNIWIFLLSSLPQVAETTKLSNQLLLPPEVFHRFEYPLLLLISSHYQATVNSCFTPAAPCPVLFPTLSAHFIPVLSLTPCTALLQHPHPPSMFPSLLLHCSATTSLSSSHQPLNIPVAHPVPPSPGSAPQITKIFSRFFAFCCLILSLFQ